MFDEHPFDNVVTCVLLLLYQLLYRADEKLRFNRSGQSVVGIVQCEVIDPFAEYLEKPCRPPVGYPMKNIKIAEIAAAAEQM